MRMIAPALFLLLLSGCATTAVLNKPLAEVVAMVEFQTEEEKGDGTSSELGSPKRLRPTAGGPIWRSWSRYMSRDYITVQETPDRYCLEAAHSNGKIITGATSIKLKLLDSGQTRCRVRSVDYGILFSERNRWRERKIIEYLKEESPRE